jgi:hypothetical protein
VAAAGGGGNGLARHGTTSKDLLPPLPVDSPVGAGAAEDSRSGEDVAGARTPAHANDSLLPLPVDSPAEQPRLGGGGGGKPSREDENEEKGDALELWPMKMLVQGRADTSVGAVKTEDIRGEEKGDALELCPMKTLGQGRADTSFGAEKAEDEEKGDALELDVAAERTRE